MATMKRPAHEWDARSREIAQLLARTGVGDRTAFAALYQHTSGQLYAVVLRIQRDRGVAEELLQDIYVSIWKAAASFDAAQSQPLTWMTSIARNRAIDSLRQAQSRPMLLSTTPREGDDDDDDGGDQAVDHDRAGPADLLDQASEARELSRCMQGLTPSQRQSLALAFFDGLSHAEVADHLREPLGTVKSWVRRALATLKTCLEQAVRREAIASAAMSAEQHAAGAVPRSGRV